MNRAFIDTNIILRATVDTMPLHSEADNLLKSLRKRRISLWISNQVIREYLVQMTRPQNFSYTLKVEDVVSNVERLKKTFHIANDSPEVVAQLLSLIQEIPVGGKQIHDANIIATMLVNKIDILVTHNVDDMRRFSSKIEIVPLVSESAN
ncbi:MAG: type II toxin-antitoxin system VapC family toxin [Anaerolineae bacterium]|nr:type II toxin-antitoxin system VapC family toxin [Anaerolineae bacterium]